MPLLSGHHVGLHVHLIHQCTHLFFLVPLLPRRLERCSRDCRPSSPLAGQSVRQKVPRGDGGLQRWSRRRSCRQGGPICSNVSGLRLPDDHRLSSLGKVLMRLSRPYRDVFAGTVLMLRTRPKLPLCGPFYATHATRHVGGVLPRRPTHGIGNRQGRYLVHHYNSAQRCHGDRR